MRAPRFTRRGVLRLFSASAAMTLWSHLWTGIRRATRAPRVRLTTLFACGQCAAITERVQAASMSDGGRPVLITCDLMPMRHVTYYYVVRMHRLTRGTTPFYQPSEPLYTVRTHTTVVSVSVKKQACLNNSPLEGKSIPPVPGTCRLRWSISIYKICIAASDSSASMHACMLREEVDAGTAVARACAQPVQFTCR